jgi:hypothetical protein
MPSNAVAVLLLSGVTGLRFRPGRHPGTGAFSKKVENHARAVALHAMYDNFVRIHQTLEMTPGWLPA